MSDLRLHIPDEPVAQLVAWRRALAEGASLREVLHGETGVLAWYWSRWRSLGRLGIGVDEFSRVGEGYARELGLWLRGERTHVATASGLLGRVARRVPEAATSRSG